MSTTANFTDIFSPTTGQFFNGAFRADTATVTIGGIDGAGLLIQNLQAQYQQQNSRLYELGSTGVYYIAGRAQGNLTVQEIVGPTAISLAFIRQFADVCQAQNNNLDIGATLGCDKATSTAFRYKIQGCVITGIGFSVRAEQVIVNQTLTMEFAAMDLVEGGA